MYKIGLILVSSREYLECGQHELMAQRIKCLKRHVLHLAEISFTKNEDESLLFDYFISKPR